MTGLQHYLETEDNEENEPDPNDIYKSYKNYNFYRIRNTLKKYIVGLIYKIYRKTYKQRTKRCDNGIYIFFFIKSTFFSRIQFVVFIIAIDFIDFLI